MAVSVFACAEMSNKSMMFKISTVYSNQKLKFLGIVQAQETELLTFLSFSMNTGHDFF